MDNIIQLLSDFIEEKIEAESFVIQYLGLWRGIRDFHYEILDKNHVIAEELSSLYETYLKHKVSQKDYFKHWSELIKQLPLMTIYPYSKQVSAMDHLFVEADAYRDDPADREAGLHIDENELRAVVLETLNILISAD